MSEYSDFMKCHKCDGRGSVGFALRTITCPSCNGTGSRPNPNTAPMTDGLRVRMTSGECWIAVGWMPAGSSGTIRKRANCFEIVFARRRNKPGYFCRLPDDDGGILSAFLEVAK